MILKAYAIRDSKAEMYNVPFFNKTHGEAERNFKQLVNDEKSMVHKYPDDYDLYHIGQYDDDKGVLIALSTPEHILKASNCVANKQQTLN